MHGHTRWVSRERPDFVRSAAERCWIDGDLIRLSHWPVGGIRPGIRGKPVPWLMDLAVLEEAMREVYGRDFDLGDRAPLLQLAADALADGDRTRAAEIADAVAFPPPEFKSRFRDAGLRHLAWGHAHRRGNPRIDIAAWLERTDIERKYDSDQPRVPRGHPDGGQWTDGAVGDAGSELDRPATREEIERAQHVVAEFESFFARNAPDSAELLHLASGPNDPYKPVEPRRGYDLPPLTEEEVARRLPSLGPAELPAVRGEPTTRGQLVRWMVRRILPGAVFAIRSKYVWIGAAAVLVEEGFPEVATYFDEAKTLGALHPNVRVEDYVSFEEFREKNPAGPGYEWHHIRERNFGSQRGWDVDSTDNIVRVPIIHHRMISALYSSKPEALGGMTVREWLRTEPPDIQWRFGLYALQRQGVMR